MIRTHAGQQAVPPPRALFKSDDTQARGRFQREQTTIDIRKNKKEEKLKSRRSKPAQDVAIPVRDDVVRQVQECKVIFQTWSKSKEDMSLAGPFSKAVKRIRTVLSEDDENTSITPIVDLVLKSDVLSFLLEALQWSDEYTELQYEAVWALTNIAASDEHDHVACVANHSGLVLEVVRLLGEGRSPSLRSQCAWCIGNIADDSKEFRDALLELDGVRNGLVHQISLAETEELRDNIVRATKLLLHSSADKPLPLTTGFVKPLLECLRQSSIDDQDLQADICWALAYLAEGDPESGKRAGVVLQFGALQTLMELMKVLLNQPPDSSRHVLAPLARCLGMIAAGTLEQTACLLDAKFLDYVVPLLSVSSRVKKETLWVCSNITAASLEQANALSRRSRAMSEIADAALSGQWPVRREALHTLTNMLVLKQESITQRVLQAGALDALCLHLDCSADVEVLLAVLEGLDAILEYNLSAPDRSLLELISEKDGIEKLAELGAHQNGEVYEKATRLYDTYIADECENDDDEQNLAPEMDGDAFQFGAAVSPQKLSFDFCARDKDIPQTITSTRAFPPI